MESSIPIFKGMDVDKPECARGSSHYWINLPFQCAIIIKDDSFHKAPEIFGACANMIGNRLLGSTIVHTDKASLPSQAKMHETCIPDNNFLQTF